MAKNEYYIFQKLKTAWSLHMLHVSAQQQATDTCSRQKQVVHKFPEQ